MLEGIRKNWLDCLANICSRNGTASINIPRNTVVNVIKVSLKAASSITLLVDGNRDCFASVEIIADHATSPYLIENSVLAGVFTLCYDGDAFQNSLCIRE